MLTLSFSQNSPRIPRRSDNAGRSQRARVPGCHRNGAANASNAAALINSSAPPPLQGAPFLPRKCRRRWHETMARQNRHAAVLLAAAPEEMETPLLHPTESFLFSRAGLCEREADGRQLKAQAAKLCHLGLITWHGNSEARIAEAALRPWKPSSVKISSPCRLVRIGIIRLTTDKAHYDCRLVNTVSITTTDW